MAIAPLFVTDLATLKSRLRLSGAAATDADAMIQQAVMDVRLGFFRRLTQTRCAVLVGYTHTDTPATDTEILRALAESTEVKWVRLFAMRTLPTAFLDGVAMNQVWQQEAPFRAALPADLAGERLALENEIAENLTILAGDQGIGTESTISTSVIGPKCAAPPVGQEIYPRYGNPFLPPSRIPCP